jgi:hypothetical protein
MTDRFSIRRVLNRIRELVIKQGFLDFSKDSTKSRIVLNRRSTRSRAHCNGYWLIISDVIYALILSKMKKRL